MATTQQWQEYFRSVLQLEPGINANQILRERLAILELKEANFSIDRPDVPEEQLEALTKILDEVRASFWTQTKQELLEKLDASDFAVVPELGLAHARLRAWVNAKPALSMLQLKIGPDQETIFSVLQMMVGEPPRVLAVAKEQVLRAMQRGRYRKLPAQAAMIEREFPTIFELDPDWFSELIRFKRVRVGSELGSPSYQVSSPQSGSSTGRMIAITVILIVVIRVAIQMMRGLNR